MGLVAAIREMIAKGLSIDQALTAAEVIEAREVARLAEMEAEDEARRARVRDGNRERQRRHRGTPVTRDERDNASSRVTAVTPPLPDKEKSPTPPKEINPTPGPPSLREGPPAQTPRSVLLDCLSPDMADAVLAHRRAKRLPLTVRAAQLLAKGFTATGDPSAAADMMIERGWQGFKPEWFDNERAGNGQQKQSKRSISDVAPGFIQRVDELFAEQEMRPANSGAAGGDPVRLLPAQRGQRS